MCLGVSKNVMGIFDAMGLIYHEALTSGLIGQNTLRIAIPGGQ